MVCFLIAFITVQQVCALAALTARKHTHYNRIFSIIQVFFAVTYSVTVCGKA